ncbi:MAG: MBL fold metallo-hydrolase [Myxococcales bacterium]|nr:MBL fold metallo-hydrolase [Myxococcales bacterium]
MFQASSCVPRISVVPWCETRGRICFAVRTGPVDAEGLPHADDGEFLFWSTLEQGDPGQLANRIAENLGLNVNAVAITGTWESPTFAAHRFTTTVVLVQVRQQSHIDNGIWWFFDDIVADMAQATHFWGPQWRYVCETIQNRPGLRGCLGKKLRYSKHWPTMSAVPRSARPTRYGHCFAHRQFFPKHPLRDRCQSNSPAATTDHIILDSNVIIFPVVSPTLAPATHTNCVVIGRQTLVVIDPATPYIDEQTRLIKFLKGLETSGARVAHVLLTHHHRDHIGAVQQVADEFQATVWAHPQTTARLPPGPIVTHELYDGQKLAFDADCTFSVLHTPGHAPGHCVFMDPEARWMVLGDMVAGEGTIIVAGADGDMSAYIRQLQRLATFPVRRAVAAHGPVLLKPQHRIQQTHKHRIWRESVILDALRSNTPSSVFDLTRRVYPGIAGAILPLAEQQLLAHLAKLEADRAVQNLGRGFWALVDG